MEKESHDLVRTRQDMTGMKCLDCMERYRNDIVNLLEYGVFEIENINIEIAEEWILY